MCRLILGVVTYFLLFMAMSSPVTASFKQDTAEINQLIRDLRQSVSLDEEKHYDSISRVIINRSERINYKSGMQKGYLFLGMSSRKEGELENAVTYFTNSLGLVENDDYTELTIVYFAFAEVYRLLQNYDLTLGYLKKAEALLIKGIKPIQLGQFHYAYANYLISTNDSNNTKLDSANMHLEIAMDIYQNIDSTYSIGSCYNLMGNLQHHLEDYPKAIDYYRQAINKFQETKFKSSLGAPYQNMAASFWNLNQYDSTLHYYGKAYESGTLHNRLTLRYSAAKDMSEVYQELGQKDSAFYYLKLSNVLEGEIYNSSKLRIIRELTQKYDFEKAGNQYKAERHNFLMVGLFMALVLALLGLSYGILWRSRKKIGVEKMRSDQLLLNILPEKVAEELKTTGKTTPEYFSNATILFADIQNFTRLSESLGAIELISLLDDYFKNFDTLIKVHGLEKIKTIGDAYLAVSGIPEITEDHAERAVTAALELQQKIKNLNKLRSSKGLPTVMFRIGIHSGPAIAGVVGQEKFQYDIWGDAVNMAARMEETGKPGEVNISSKTYKLIRHLDFQFEHRGKIPAKNKGEIEMYFVNSKQYATNKSENPLKHSKYEKFYKDFTTQLIEGLDKELTYHGYHHVQDVLKAAKTIGDSENLSDKDWDLLNTSILLHDSGFMFGYDNHEERSCDLADRILPDYGYSKDELDIIKGMIRATKIPQQPNTLMEMIIADADLEYLGTDRFDDVSETLFKEWNNKDLMQDRDLWNKTQVKFISAHHYFTDFCKQNRQQPKQKNLDRIRLLLLD
jgi:class 3 adenylate cyclase/predicted metal-dependent HD superfamily phosphohydrolase